jgi:hypothetical protein
MKSFNYGDEKIGSIDITFAVASIMIGIGISLSRNVYLNTPILSMVGSPLPSADCFFCSLAG